MATVLEVRVPIEQFALAATFDAVADLHVEMERFAGHDFEGLMPFVWVATDEFDAFEDALEADPSVEDFSVLSNPDDERLYRLAWSDDVERAMSLLFRNGAITTASTTGESWELRVMCPEHDSVSELYDLCEENGLSLAVDSIYRLDGGEGLTHGLTEPQHDSLLKANEMGYYDVPRRVTLSELADELGVSHQALSERLRRGHGRLIDHSLKSGDTVGTERPPDPN